MKFKKKQLGFALMAIGLALVLLPSVLPLTFVSGHVTIYCSENDPVDWSYHLFLQGAEITANPGCSIESGWISHSCPTGEPTCVERDSNNFCAHWVCETTTLSCANTCNSGESQNAFPDCACVPSGNGGESPIDFRQLIGFAFIGIGFVMVKKK